VERVAVGVAAARGVRLPRTGRPFRGWLIGGIIRRAIDAREARPAV